MKSLHYSQMKNKSGLMILSITYLNNYLKKKERVTGVKKKNRHEQRQINSPSGGERWAGAKSCKSFYVMFRSLKCILRPMGSVDGLNRAVAKSIFPSEKIAIAV